MTESERIPEESVENLRFLVEHFRKLAQDKDIVIIQYREILEKVKPFIDREQTFMMRISRQNEEISSLKESLNDIKRKMEKPGKRKGLVA